MSIPFLKVIFLTKSRPGRPKRTYVHLSSIKSGKIPAAAKNSTPEQIDSLITNYQTQIRQAVQAANSVPNGVAGAKPEPGALFSINA